MSSSQQDGGTTDRLLEAVRQAAGSPGLGWASDPVVLTGGFSSQMWRVRLRGSALAGDLVARVMPDAEVAERETLVQRYLAETGYPTPRVRLAASPGPNLDRAWMLMDYVPADPLMPDLAGLRSLLRIPQLARSLPDSLARSAALLHAVDPDPMRSALGGGDETSAFVTQMRDRMETHRQPDLVEVAERLLATGPPSARVVICHGDLHPFNVLRSADGDSVIDWSSARIADPTYDLAFTSLLLSHPPLQVPRPLRGVMTAAGRLLSRRFLRTYSALTGEEPEAERLQWYTLVSALRMLVEVTDIRSGEHDLVPADHPFVMLEPTLRRLITATTPT